MIGSDLGLLDIIGLVVLSLAAVATLVLALVPRDAARVVLMHHPDSFEQLPAGTGPVAFAAHTHGGQVRLPLTPEWSWLTFIRGDKVHADWWVSGDYGASGNRRSVNHGIGFSYVPMRVNCPPELTRFTLRRVVSARPAPHHAPSLAPARRN